MAENWSIAGTLALLVILGFGVRIHQLGAIGFAEDEMNKLDAIHAYERGDFTANSEHPMVMKLLMWASLRGIPASSEEVALRLPNALIGALTVIPLFLLTATLFDRWHALLAAAFWTFGINAITLNRIGKEDTLLVFFMLFGFYFFLRAKQISPTNQPARYKRYAASAVSFLIGLVISIKRWRDVGHGFVLFMFLFWIVPYSLIGAKWLRCTLSLMPFVYMLAAIGVVGLIRWMAQLTKSRRAAFVLTVAIAAIFIGGSEAPPLLKYL